MTYRDQAEKPADAPALPTRLRCERCNIPVPMGDDPQCPQCFRRSTVIDPMRLKPAEREFVAGSFSASPARPTVWPYNDTCPICAKDDVGETSVFLHVSKIASSVGSVSARITVRIHTCANCRKRVERLESLRYVAAGAVLIGLPLVFGFFIGGAGGIALGILGVLLFATALLGFTSMNRGLRRVIDQSGISASVSDLVPNPSGIIEHEHWNLMAKASDESKVVDLVDLLRQSRVRSLG